MWLKSVQLKNIKSFADTGAIDFSPGINLLVGPNNAGKSIFIRAISLLQPLPNHPDASAVLAQSLRHSATDCEIILELKDPNRRQLKLPAQWDINNWSPQLRFVRNPRNSIAITIFSPNRDWQNCQNPICNQTQPENFIYPYFSRRKPVGLHEGINLANAQTIEEALQHLPSKVDNLSTSRDGATFNDACQKTLGFTVACVQSPQGKQLGLMLSDDTIIPVTSMGEGTINILAFLVHLSSASGKLFLIEEIEND